MAMLFSQSLSQMQPDFFTPKYVLPGGTVGAPSSSKVFHCAIHGTVTSCPFKFMACDSEEGNEPGTAPGWLRAKLKAGGDY
jgi:hypothetical protein